MVTNVNQEFDIIIKRFSTMGGLPPIRRNIYTNKPVHYAIVFPNIFIHEKLEKEVTF